jgi:hypothetical protein
MSSLLALLATPLIMACPGASASIAIEDAELGHVDLAFCHPQQCQEVLNKLAAGETAIFKEAIAIDRSEDEAESWVITHITRSPDNQFTASIQFPDEEDPEVLQGKLTLGGGMRGGCGSEIEYASLPSLPQFPRFIAIN